MSLGSRLVARMAGLPPASTRDIGVEHDLPVPMPDGAVLLADRYFPRGSRKPPLILMRTPYGRRRMGVLGRIYAERGYQVVIQSTRGTFGSGGKFSPLRGEDADGRATLDWLAAQDWFGDSMATAGPSYLGFVQWALAADAPSYLKALAVQIASSNRRDPMYQDESFALDTALSWVHTVHYQEMPLWRVLWEAVRQRRALAPAFAHVPLRDTDRIAVGTRVEFYQNWLVHTQPGDPYWEETNYRRRIGDVSAQVNLVGGWYDFFLPGLLADYRALRQAGRTPYLTIGPWMHTSVGVTMAGLRESLAWCDAHLRGDSSRLRVLPVRVFVMGCNRWLDLPDWPPSATATRWYLQANRGLAPITPETSTADRYVYDPADPTPAVGGTVLGRHGGPRDNRSLESRPDVLTYTGAPLERDVEVIGPVAAELHVRSSLENTDFFVRLCDVEPGGRSLNVCDGLMRLWPGRFPANADGTSTVKVDLWPTACCFRRGHRLRLQVSSGAHPRYNRNLGSGEPLATATTFEVAHQEVYHDPTHPSAVILPVR